MKYYLLTLLLMPAVAVAEMGGEPHGDIEMKVDDKMLSDVAVELNKQVPLAIDQDLRLDRVTSGDHRLTYNYTLVNYGREELNVELLKKNFTAEVKANICGQFSMRDFIDNKVTIVNNYKDKNSQQLMEIAIASRQCEGVEVVKPEGHGDHSTADSSKVDHH